MTEHLHDDRLDREIRSFLDWRAEDLVDAPSATEMALLVDSRVSRAPAWPRLQGRLTWVALAVLLMGLLAAAALVSGLIPTRDDLAQRSYEAVFVRLEEAGPDIDVIVVAVNAKGVEREIVHLPTLSASSRYGADGPNASLGSLAAVSTTGLLALPRTTGDYLFDWEIVDLHRPGAAPIEVPGLQQDYDVRPYPFDGSAFRPPAVWGPGEHVAIFQFERAGGNGVYWISMINGRTGAGAVLPHPDATLLPYWATDGSGILAASSVPSPGTQVFRMDGSLGSVTVGFVSDGHGRRYRMDGTPSGTFADLNPDPDLERSTLAQLLTGNRIDIGDVAWTVDGNSRWLLLPGFDDRKLRLERLTSEGPAVVVTLRDDAAGPDTIDAGRIVGLAPDDSIVIVKGQRFRFVPGPAFESDPDTRSAEVVVPATGLNLDVAGYFAGWLEVPH